MIADQIKAVLSKEAGSERYYLWSTGLLIGVGLPVHIMSSMIPVFLMAIATTADEIKDVQGFPTAMKRTMANVKTGHKTEVVFERIQYNVGLGDDLFSERYLRRPPEKWIK